MAPRPVQALSCQSAAAARGWQLLRPPDRPHLVRSSGRPLPGAVVHRGGVPTAGVLDPLAVLAGCIRCLPLVEAAVAAESAVRDGALGLGDLEALRRTGSGAARIASVLAVVRPGAGSGIETAARVELHMAGVRDVRTQVRVRGVGWVDLLVEGWLVVEVDGFAHHSSRADYRRDRARGTALARAGLVLLRCTWEDVVLHPRRLVEAVQEVLDRGRPPCGDPRAVG